MFGLEWRMRMHRGVIMVGVVSIAVMALLLKRGTKLELEME